MMTDDEDTYEIPLQDQKVFGAGLKRKRIQFVPSSTVQPTQPLSSGTSSGSISDFYLKLVLPKEAVPSTTPPSVPISLLTSSPPGSSMPASKPQICEVCSLPIAMSTETSPDLLSSSEPMTSSCSSKSRPHEASLAHQVCLSHSHPPSHLDRNRKGLAYLSSYGWDPDSRRGLGANGQGIQFPIKTRPKDDKLGIGVVLPQEGERRKREKVEKLDAGKVRKLHEKDKRKAEKLREMFYRNDDVERYLGGG